MANDNPLKSAYEVAMERLRKRDGETGISEKPPTDGQKTAMAEIRAFYRAKLAEQEVLHQSRLRATPDPVERESLDANFRRDRDQLVSQRDLKIEKIRHGEPP